VIPVAIALALLAQAGTEDKTPAPPFKVVITAKTNTAADVEMRTFEEVLKELKKYAAFISKNPVVVDREAWDAWTFEVAPDKKFDPTPFWHTFINIKCKSYRLSMTGTLSQEATTKKLFITAAMDKAKVKIMNKPKNAFDKETEVEDVVAKMTAGFEEGRLKWKVEGEIFSHGGALALLVDTYAPVGLPPKGSTPTGSTPKAEPKKVPPPPFTVTVTAKTRFARGKRTYQDFRDRVEKVKSYCKLVSESPVPNDQAGWEYFTFEISGERNLDLGLFPQLFGDMKCGKFELALVGSITQDPQTKAIFLTSHNAKVKVKILNKPKQVGTEAEDKVAKFAEAVAATENPYFWVEGEVFNQGGQLSILLDQFRKASRPPEPK
jgi:hypothetical protein